jgi:hypothetical protein
MRRRRSRGWRGWESRDCWMWFVRRVFVAARRVPRRVRRRPGTVK